MAPAGEEAARPLTGVEAPPPSPLVMFSRAILNTTQGVAARSPRFPPWSMLAALRHSESQEIPRRWQMSFCCFRQYATVEKAVEGIRPMQDATKFADVALRCCSYNRHGRPPLEEVVGVLQELSGRSGC